MSDLLPLMISKAIAALPHSYSPYSNYAVACCIRAEDDSLHTGVNVENTAYGLTTCAEASAISSLITAGKRQIKAIALLNGQNTLCTPCGGCRQRLFEFSTAQTLIHLCDHNAVIETLSIEQLLPFAFKFKPFSGNKDD